MNTFIRPLQRRTLFTSAPASKQFLVLIRDFNDPEALERRLAIRGKHLAEAEKEVAAEKILSGGAILDTHESGRMIGSCMIWEAESEDEVRQKLENDPYTKGKVWEEWDIFPYRNAVGKLPKGQ
ncbi:hypothetical protein BJV82DRAFT_587659 [Fennellomyces sp. T-0311]|nr:hypothetical protein BJV82DRAFT_587659 [Fennellomyces sp. T-0311]